jgi:hypothetical protein
MTATEIVETPNIVMAMILILRLKAKSCAAAESCREKGEEVEERNSVL